MAYLYNNSYSPRYYGAYRTKGAVDKRPRKPRTVRGPGCSKGRLRVDPLCSSLPGCEWTRGLVTGCHPVGNPGKVAAKRPKTPKSPRPSDLVSGVVRGGYGYTPGYYSPLYNRYIWGGQVQLPTSRPGISQTSFRLLKDK